MSDAKHPLKGEDRLNRTRLFGECADGRLSDEGKATLADLLKNDAAALEQWFRFQDAELGLAKWAAKTIASQRPQNHLPVPVPTRTAWFRRRPIAWAGLALVLVTALVAIGGRLVVPPTEAVARVLELKNCRWVAAALQVGDQLRSGQRIEISSGQMVVGFESGVVVTLVGPSIFETTSANSAYLLIGHMKAKADSPTLKGFMVRTRTTRVVDLGTEFVATASADGYCRVDVTTGDVDVHLDGIEAPQRLHIGDALNVEPGERQIMTRVETGDNSAKFRFPTIEPPSNSDYADRAFGRATIRRVGGKFDRISGPIDVLIDGVGQSAADVPEESVFFEANEPGYLQLDLGRAVAIQKINTYSWHCNANEPDDRGRAVQKFFLYGCAGDTAPGTDGSLTDNGWVLLARVNTDETLGVLMPQDRPAQQASSVTSARGDIGRYRYLLWKVLPSKHLHLPRLDNTFYGEIDVYATP